MLVRVPRRVLGFLLAGALAVPATAQDGGPPVRATPVAPARQLIEVRSVPPASRPDDRPGRVVAYGLTYADLDRIKAMAGVARAVPVRQFPRQARYLQHATDVEVVGTTAEFAAVAGLEFVWGRPLGPDDDARFENYVVLGPTVAADLFPEESPVGKAIRLGTDYYTVIGVAQARPAPPPANGAVNQDVLDRAVYLPLNTCRLRFGERIVLDNPRRIEEVQLSRIILEVHAGADGAAVAAQVRAALKPAHPGEDVAVVVPRPDPAVK